MKYLFTYRYCCLYFVTSLLGNTTNSRCGILLLDLSILHFDLQDQFDTIDLSDNEIVKLENFPYLNRLGTLILNNNRITRINPNIGGDKAIHSHYILVLCLLVEDSRWELK